MNRPPAFQSYPLNPSSHGPLDVFIDLFACVALSDPERVGEMTAEQRSRYLAGIDRLLEMVAGTRDAWLEEMLLRKRGELVTRAKGAA